MAGTDDLAQIKKVLTVIGLLVATGLVGWSFLIWGLYRELGRLRAVLASIRSMLSARRDASPATPPPVSRDCLDWKKERAALQAEQESHMARLRETAAMDALLDAAADQARKPAAD